MFIQQPKIVFPPFVLHCLFGMFRFVVLRARSSLSFASCIFVLVFGAVSNINHIAWAGNTWARGQFVGFRQDEASLGLAKANGDKGQRKGGGLCFVHIELHSAAIGAMARFGLKPRGASWLIWMCFRYVWRPTIEKAVNVFKVTDCGPPVLQNNDSPNKRSRIDAFEMHNAFQNRNI